MSTKVTAIFISPCTGQTINQVIITTLSIPATVLVGITSIVTLS